MVCPRRIGRTWKRLGRCRCTEEEGTMKAGRQSVATDNGEPRRQIGFIGGGNMAGALIRGLIGAGLYRADQIWASDVDPQKRAALRRRFRIGVSADNAVVLRGAKLIVLAVKPQILDTVLAELRPVARPSHTFLSIAAGVTTKRLEEQLRAQARVLRIMPNQPALLGKGMSVLVRGRSATAADARVGLL